MAQRRDALGPFKLSASLHETLWGGRQLEMVVGKRLPDSKLIGESWETATDAVIMNGPCAGMSLQDAVDRHRASLLGERAIEVFGMRFPLLAKFLDARDWLSVQAHPSDAYAAVNENGKLGKTEAWYILDAVPGAQIVYGVNRSTSREEVERAVARNELEALLRYVEIFPGDVVFVPAGTVHAIGAGVVLYELQEYSDVTYRLYDYGRLQTDGNPRELHVSRALDVMRLEPSPVVKVSAVAGADLGFATSRTLCACQYFVEEEVRLAGPIICAPTSRSCQILSVVEGSCLLHADEKDVCELILGDTVVVPASVTTYRLEGTARIVRSYVPEAEEMALQVWRNAQQVAFS